MQHIKTGTKRGFFQLLARTRSAQAAMMTLRTGQSTSNKPENEHPWSEQWLFVISGTGRAVIGKRRETIRENSLLLIEKSEAHRIVNTGRKALVTLNLYVPLAYREDGELLR